MGEEAIAPSARLGDRFADCYLALWLVDAFLIVAAGTASAASGTLVMIVFALGSVPALAGLAFQHVATDWSLSDIDSLVLGRVGYFGGSSDAA